MQELLQLSKSRLLKPSKTAKRRVLIILNVTYIIATCIFLITQKMNTGMLAHNAKLFYFGYLPALIINFLSLAYHLLESFSLDIPKKINGNLLSICSIIPVFFMSFLNQIGYGNPGFDSILFDYPLAIALILVAAMVINRKAAIVWSVILICTLSYNVSIRGINYQYHYLTPNEAIEYETALTQGIPDALQRQQELKAAKLNPPQITRYTLQWSIFIIITMMTVMIFMGANKKVINLVAPVIDEIEKETLQLARKKADLEKEIVIKTEKQKMSDLREQTFINIAHEIRTPLTLINNSLDEYVADHEPNEKLEAIKLHISKLTRDVVNFFDLEKLEKGFEPYDHGQILNFSETLRLNLLLFEALVSKKNITLESNIDEEIYVKADPVAIESIIQNLFENAIKYTNEGGKIFIDLVSTSGEVTFSVKDNGIGIKEGMQNLVFRPYYQIKTKKRNSDGMGLGLPIVKKIVDRLGWKISLESKEGEGTSFSVKMPIHLMPKMNQDLKIDIKKYTHLGLDNIAVKDIIHDGTRNNLLVVEDNLEMLKYLVCKLGEKYNVYAAKSGTEALDKLKTIKRVDLIISDIMMDGIDGIEFYKRVLKDEQLNHIAFIFLSAKTAKKSREEGLALGALDYIDKPFDFIELGHKVESILANKQKQLSIFGSALIHNTLNAMPANSNKQYWERQKVQNEDSFESACKSFGLTPKEIEVSRFVSLGLPYKQIADKLNISERTVHTHMKKIFEKVSVSNKVELINKLRPFQ